MSILPKPKDAVLWLKGVLTECVLSASTLVCGLCILVYLLSITAMAMDGNFKNNAKRYAIGSLMSYFLMKALVFLLM